MEKRPHENLVLAGLAAVLLVQVQAADDDGKELPPIERYDYGMPLDIERVLSVTPVPATCGVVPLVMLYRDSAGRLHRLQYRGLGAGCSRH